MSCNPLTVDTISASRVILSVDWSRFRVLSETRSEQSKPSQPHSSPWLVMGSIPFRKCTPHTTTDTRLDDAIEACRTTAMDMHSHCKSF